VLTYVPWPVESLCEPRRDNWRRAVATALAGLGMMGAPMKAHGQEWWQATPAQAEQAVTQAWSQLSPKQQQNLRQEERDWIKWKDKLPADRRTWATADRAHYLQAHKKGGKDAADKSLYHTFSGDFISPGDDGKLTFDPAAATQEDIRSYDTPTPSPQEQQPSSTKHNYRVFYNVRGEQRAKPYAYSDQAGSENEVRTDLLKQEPNAINIEIHNMDAETQEEPAATPPTKQTIWTKDGNEEITSSTKNWVVDAVRKALARSGAPADIGAPAKLITFNYTGETTVDGEKMFTATLIVNMENLYVNGYGHRITDFQFEGHEKESAIY